MFIVVVDFLMVFFFLLVGILGFVLFYEHPISVGFWFIVYSVGVSVSVGLECSSYFGYLVFFVYVGALLVVFCMVVSLTPNPIFRVVPFFGLMPFFYWVGKDGVEIVQGAGVVFSGDDCSDGFSGLGNYSGFSWGGVLGWLGLILLLGVISVASMCKRFSGPLVRFKGGG